jgi:hypothetical protein
LHWHAVVHLAVPTAKSAWRRPVDGALAVRGLRYCNTIKGILVAGPEHDGQEHTRTSRRWSRPICSRRRRCSTWRWRCEDGPSLEDALRQLNLFGMLETLEPA